jgi:branched-chain amino acid transport system substrate-binding protein
VLKDDLEHVMDSVPWANFKHPRTPAVAAEYTKRSNGKTWDTNSGYSYDAVFVIADTLERAASLDDPDAIVDALRKTSYTGGLMQYGGPVQFNQTGDNPNAITTMIQVLGQKPVAVWPREAAVQKLVFPRPRA